jgi:hypothetical protein
MRISIKKGHYNLPTLLWSFRLLMHLRWFSIWWRPTMFIWILLQNSRKGRAQYLFQVVPWVVSCLTFPTTRGWLICEEMLIFDIRKTVAEAMVGGLMFWGFEIIWWFDVSAIESDIRADDIHTSSSLFVLKYHFVRRNYSTLEKLSISTFAIWRGYLLIVMEPTFIAAVLNMDVVN